MTPGCTAMASQAALCITESHQIGHAAAARPASRWRHRRDLTPAHQDRDKAYVGKLSAKSSRSSTSIHWEQHAKPRGDFRRQPDGQRGAQLARGIDSGTRTGIRPRLAAERRTQVSHGRRGALTDGVGGGGKRGGDCCALVARGRSIHGRTDARFWFTHAKSYRPDLWSPVAGLWRGRMY